MQTPRRFLKTPRRCSKFAAAFIRNGTEMSFSYTTPCAIMALATFMKPAMLAPFT